jgi:NADPH:quinone reductase-like Zn-dependent oxidoreductase
MVIPVRIESIGAHDTPIDSHESMCEVGLGVAAQMRAQVYSRYGGPEVLELRADRPSPSFGAHEVLVEIHGSSVNPIDWKLRAGHLRWVIPLRLPFVPGRDFAGVVLACGRRATGVAPGDRVFGLAPLRGPGSHAEQIAISESLVALAPARLSSLEAAALPLVGLTAIQAVEAAHVRPGDRVLVQGGAGAVGSLAIQYARHLGAEVSTTTSTRNLDYVRELGVDLAIDYTHERFEDRVRELDAVIDCVGGDIERRSFAVLRTGGRLIGVAGSIRSDQELGPRVLAGGALHVPGRLLGQLARGHRYRFVSARCDHDRLRRLAQLVDRGVLDVRIDRTFPLAELAAAHLRSEQGLAQGKIVIDHGA